VDIPLFAFNIDLLNVDGIGVNAPV